MTFVWRNTIFWSCLLTAIVRFFACTYNGSSILQPNYKFTVFIHLSSYFLLLYNQTQSLFAFIPGERSKWAQCYSCDEKALSSRPPWFSLKIKVYKILAQPRDVWEIVLCFDVILSFSITIQITDAKQTWLVIHSSKRKDGTLYKWSVELRRF